MNNVPDPKWKGTTPDEHEESSETIELREKVEGYFKDGQLEYLDHSELTIFKMMFERY